MLTVEGQPSGLGWRPDGPPLVVSMKDRRPLARSPDGTVGAGADLFLTKPFSPLRLLRLVDELGHGAA